MLVLDCHGLERDGRVVDATPVVEAVAAEPVDLVAGRGPCALLKVALEGVEEIDER